MGRTQRPLRNRSAESPRFLPFRQGSPASSEKPFPRSQLVLRLRVMKRPARERPSRLPGGKDLNTKLLNSRERGALTRSKQPLYPLE